MNESFGVNPPEAYLVALPQLGELVAGANESAGEVRREGTGPIPGDSAAEQRDVDPAVLAVILGMVPLSVGRIGEPAVWRVTRIAYVLRLVTQQCDRVVSAAVSRPAGP
ncbi:hypothetical protein GCM10022222_01070 [Amycolatopsis ultiminotia]|uniref:Uncharacterized protein n=1 Tax=Amycolatopsis ultiminotia TaxID=543629 RepID=A0ABP6UXV6_9PSEU